MLVDRRASVPAFSQSKASFSAMPRSFMLLSNTDMINCRGWGGQEDREVTPGLARWKGQYLGMQLGGGRGVFQVRDRPRGDIGKRDAH